MNFYVSFKPIDELKKYIFNVKKQFTIDVINIFKEYRYNIKENNNKFKEILINRKIENLLDYSISRKFDNIIYSNPYLGEETLFNLLSRIQSKSIQYEFIFLTEYEKNKEFYKYFDKIIFYLEIKKMRIFN